MNWITNRIKQFIVKTIIDDYAANGAIRQTITQDSAPVALQFQRSAALFGKVASEHRTPGSVKARSAFKEAAG